MADQVDRLASTANYMGYDALATHYDTLQSGITAFSSKCRSAGELEIKEFLQTTIGTSIESIRNLFPEAQSLAAIDTTMLNPVAANDAASDSVIGTDLQSSSEFDQLLAGLPSIDDHDRDILLSKSLDETFSSMKKW